MELLMRLADNWDNILVVIFLTILLVGATIKWLRHNGPIFREMGMAERIAYTTRLLTNLLPIAIVLVTDAEIIYGDKTGSIKRSYVIDELYKRIPEDYRKYVSEENLSSIVEKALDVASGVWQSSGLLHRSSDKHTL